MIPENAAYEEFCDRFGTDEVCSEALYQARWPNGFRCPACSHSRCYLISTRRLPLYECVSCKRQTSVTAGTVMEGSSTPLPLWFRAFYLLSRPSGISSSRLSELLGVTYKTAWLISHKIRHALQQADQEEALTGAVRVETFNYGSFLYLDAQQPLVIGAALNEEEQPILVKIKQPDPAHVHSRRRQIEKAGIDAFVSEHTDGRNVRTPARFDKSLPSLTGFKRGACAWLNFTFNGIGAKHLQAYLDEFCFRINAMLRDLPVLNRLIRLCAATNTLIYKVLIREKPVLPVPWRIWGSRAKWKGKHLSAWTA